MLLEIESSHFFALADIQNLPRQAGNLMRVARYQQRGHYIRTKSPQRIDLVPWALTRGVLVISQQLIQSFWCSCGPCDPCGPLIIDWQRLMYIFCKPI
jgi:hypothetical protein